MALNFNQIFDYTPINYHVNCVIRASVITVNLSTLMQNLKTKILSRYQVKSRPRSGRLPTRSVEVGQVEKNRPTLNTIPRCVQNAMIDFTKILPCFSNQHWCASNSMEILPNSSNLTNKYTSLTSKLLRLSLATKFFHVYWQIIFFCHSFLWHF